MRRASLLRCQRHPLSLGVPIPFPLFSISISISISILYPFLFVGAIGFGCDRSGVGTRAIGQYRRCSAATFLLIPDGLRCDAPIEDLIKGIRCIRRSASIRFTTHRARLLNHLPELVEQLPVQDSTTTNPGPGIFLFAPPYQGFELLWAANPLKGKGRLGHSVGLCRVGNSCWLLLLLVLLLDRWTLVPA